VRSTTRPTLEVDRVPGSEIAERGALERFRAHVEPQVSRAALDHREAGPVDRHAGAQVAVFEHSVRTHHEMRAVALEDTSDLFD
jgi:hypothetical protein